jgi:hypothetical protein
MAAEREIVDPLDVQVVAMRRRHLRSVVRIEAQVYPRPWTHSLFVSELALRSTRAYYVAKVGRDIAGYAGLMMSLSDGHVTTLAVDPAWHRHHIGTRSGCRTRAPRSCTNGSDSRPLVYGRAITPTPVKTRS